MNEWYQIWHPSDREGNLVGPMAVGPYPSFLIASEDAKKKAESNPGMKVSVCRVSSSYIAKAVVEEISE